MRPHRILDTDVGRDGTTAIPGKQDRSDDRATRDQICHDTEQLDDPDGRDEVCGIPRRAVPSMTGSSATSFPNASRVWTAACGRIARHFNRIYTVSSNEA